MNNIAMKTLVLTRSTPAIAIWSAVAWSSLGGCSLTEQQTDAKAPSAAPGESHSSGPDSLGPLDTNTIDPIDTLPAEVLDLMNWKITLPFGEPHHPTEIKQPALSSFEKDGYFYASDQGVVFRAHAGGVTTPNSSYPRTELREMWNDGSERAAWSTSQGRHTMMYTAAITEIPVAKPHIVAGQVHDAKDDVLMVRLERTHLFVEGGGNNLGTLTDDYVLGTPFSIVMDASQGRVRVYYNGEATPRVDVERPVQGCYFKLGAYVQSNPSKGDRDDAMGEVIVSKLAVYHEE